MKVRLLICLFLSYSWCAAALDNDSLPFEADAWEELGLLSDDKQFESSCPSPQELLTSVVVALDGLGVPLSRLLAFEIYLRTNPVNQRSLHDLPMFEWYCLDNCNLSIRIAPFYNQTSTMYFTRNSSFIDSYVSLIGNNVLDEIIQKIEPLFDPEKELQINEVLPVFSPIKLQERRVGGMFQVCYNYCGW